MLLTYPEDSVLRRHAITTEKMMRRQAPKNPPTDSILSRHYRQMQEQQAVAPGQAPGERSRASSRPSAARASVTPAEPTAPEPPITEYTPPQARGGMFGFFRRLLGF